MESRRDFELRQTSNMAYIVESKFGDNPSMIDEEQKKRIGLYSPQERSRTKASRRRQDAAEIARGGAEIVQEKNRGLPHASEFLFPDREPLVPFE